jgi:hypothetical protein
MLPHFPFINPFGTPEPFGTKQITRRLEGAVEMAIKAEKRNGADDKLDLTLLGMPGPFFSTNTFGEYNGRATSSQEAYCSNRSRARQQSLHSVGT